MILRIAACIALAMYVTSQLSPFVGGRNDRASTGWQLTHNQVDATFQLAQHLTLIPQIMKDQQNARYIVFMLGMSSATSGVVAAIIAGFCNRAWLCLTFSVAATTSALIVFHYLLVMMQNQSFAFGLGAWLWLGSMSWLVLASAWTLCRRRKPKR